MDSSFGRILLSKNTKASRNSFSTWTCGRSILNCWGHQMDVYCTLRNKEHFINTSSKHTTSWTATRHISHSGRVHLVAGPPFPTTCWEHSFLPAWLTIPVFPIKSNTSASTRKVDFQIVGKIDPAFLPVALLVEKPGTWELCSWVVGYCFGNWAKLTRLVKSPNPSLYFQSQQPSRFKELLDFFIFFWTEGEMRQLIFQHAGWHNLLELFSMDSVVYSRLNKKCPNSTTDNN